MMLSAILLANQASAGKWQIAGVGSDGVYTADRTTLSIDFDKAGMTYAAPYPVYHKLIDTSSSFVVPVDSKGDAGWNAEFNVVGWSMTVKDGNSQVSSCSGTINTQNCSEGNWCNVPCDKEFTAAECGEMGWPEGCGNNYADGSPTPWSGESWVKKCDGTAGGFCTSNDSSCCEEAHGAAQQFPGAQFCDTIWMDCAGTPVVGKQYDITIQLQGTSQWTGSPVDGKTLTTKYEYTGEAQTYSGAYKCSQPSDNSYVQLCKTGEGQSNWEFVDHPNYKYNEYEFNYPSVDPSAKVVGAYWTEWAAYKRFVSAPDDVSRRYYVQNSPFHQLTHLLYAFVPVCGNGPTGQGQIALCAVNDCQSSDMADLRFGNPYFNLRARACKFNADGTEAQTADAQGWNQLESDFEVAIHDPWSAFHVAGGQLLALESVKEQYPHLKILPSVGGWTLSKMFFYMDDIAHRAKFVNSCEKFLRTWKVFDGIDIDWEFPGGGGQDDGSNVDLWEWPLDNPSTSTMADLYEESRLTAKTVAMETTGNEGMKDSDTYVALMHELRTMLDNLGQEFGRTYELSSAVSAGKAKIEKVAYGEIADVMDHIFIMSYDLDGAWSKKVGHQTNLYAHPDKPDMDSCAGAAELIRDQGFPMEKLAMGVAMYGRGWQDVGEGHDEEYIGDDGNAVYGINMWGHGTDNTTGCLGDIEAGVVDYSTIHLSATTLADYCNYFYDDCAEAPLLECFGQVYTYDNPRSVAAKGKYVIENNMAGLFAWVLDQDNGDILNAMHESLGHPVTKGTPVLRAGGYPESTCKGAATSSPTETTTTAETTSTAETTTTTKSSQPGDMICCVEVSAISRFAECAVSTESDCSSDACTWTEAANCVDSVFPDGSVGPTAAPNTTTTSPTTTTAKSTTTTTPTTTTPKSTTTTTPTTTTPKSTTTTTAGGAGGAGGACMPTGVAGSEGQEIYCYRETTQADCEASSYTSVFHWCEWVSN